MTDKYGKTEEEIKAEKSLICRQIVSEINRFGVDESQRVHIIKLLALELENNQSMKKIVNVIAEINQNEDIDKKDQRLIGL